MPADLTAVSAQLLSYVCTAATAACAILAVIYGVKLMISIFKCVAMGGNSPSEGIDPDKWEDAR